MFQINCFLIELFWRSHLQYPSVYKSDTIKIFSIIFPFNRIKALESTVYLEKLWKKVKLLSLFYTKK